MFPHQANRVQHVPTDQGPAYTMQHYGPASNPKKPKQSSLEKPKPVEKPKKEPTNYFV